MEHWEVCYCSVQILIFVYASRRWCAGKLVMTPHDSKGEVASSHSFSGAEDLTISSSWKISSCMSALKFSRWHAIKISHPIKFSPIHWRSLIKFFRRGTQENISPCICKPMSFYFTNPSSPKSCVHIMAQLHMGIHLHNDAGLDVNHWWVILSNIVINFFYNLFH